jgi:hypothetical protein
MVLQLYVFGVHEIARIGLQKLGAQQSSWGCAVHDIYLSIVLR